MKKWIGICAALLLAAGILRTAGDAGFWRQYVGAMRDGGAASAARRVQPRLRVPGPAAELPQATADAELIAVEALRLATELARQQGAQALLVHRHGHRVHEYFAAGRSGATELEGGELSPAVMALSLGPLVDARRMEPETAVAALRTSSRKEGSWRNPWSGAARRRFSLAAPPMAFMQDQDGGIAETISARLWLPLGAADAWLWGVDDSLLRLDCCVVARIDDWMRVADLLLQQGSYQGQRIASPDWIRRLLAADAAGERHPVWLKAQEPWTGEEAPATRDIYWFDLGSDVRLWLAPRRALTVLHWAGDGDSRDTLLPNTILRGLLDQTSTVEGAPGLGDLVPGH